MMMLYPSINCTVITSYIIRLAVILTVIINNINIIIYATTQVNQNMSNNLNRHRRCSDIHSYTQARVAVGFFGVSRNLSSTIGSIERHVFDVLDRNNIRYVFI
jgi:hypothetical protein